ncbi:cysteine protease-like protein-related [Anaeramoeba flamelloides]|uniref:Cysteine protease-like protein-related n=1 Tax=Anaeramoeba flamelloides TaxID=1746091 RepID=A0ABQ8ZC33_9EUKA|nr:cysteine protease-like protein-related [Anaeramoeba flamelloides]
MSPELQWTQYKATHNLKFNAKEDALRLGIFKNNLKTIHNLNKKGGAQYGVTQFSHLTTEEFKGTYTNRRPIPKNDPKTVVTYPVLEDIPDAFDWTKSDPPVVEPVYNQGQCGSCWAFSGVEAIQAAYAISGKPLTDFSVQEIVDCNHIDGVAGCDGGWPFTVYEYIQTKSKGLENKSDYPYVGVDQTCAESAGKIIKFDVPSYQNISKDEEALVGVVYNQGPVSMAMDATLLQFYFGGIIDYEPCGKTLDHALLIVGYGTGKHLGSEVKYWKIKNSWGASWGESGYYRIVRNKDKCGLAQALTIPKVN